MERRQLLLMLAGAGAAALTACVPRPTSSPTRTPSARAGTVWTGTLNALTGLPDHPFEIACTVSGEGVVISRRYPQGPPSGTPVPTAVPTRPYDAARQALVATLVEQLRNHPTTTAMCMDGAMSGVKLSSGAETLERGYNCSDMAATRLIVDTVNQLAA